MRKEALVAGNNQDYNYDFSQEPQPNFADFIDLNEMQALQDSFSKATGVASIITDPYGKPLTRPSNFCALCNLIRSTKVGLAACIHSDAVIGQPNKDGPHINPCLSGGLWDGGASLFVAGKHVANWLIGQVLAGDEQVEPVLRYAIEIGVEPEKARSALAEITRMPLERFNNTCQFLFQLAQQMSKLATENWEKRNEIRQRGQAEKLQKALYLISETVSSSDNLEELYRSVHTIVGELIPAKNFFIATHDETTGMLHFPYRVDECDGNPGSRKFVKGMPEYVIRTGKPILINPELRAKLEVQGEVKTVWTPGLDWLGVPLKTASNKVFGVMAVQTFTERVRYTEKDQDILTFVSNQVAMAIERKQAEEDYRYLSMHDILTGLYNRAYFEEGLNRFQDEGQLPITVVMCDIDGLKLINDTFGHSIGDKLLVATAKIIRSLIRPEAVAARIGGDEFAIILPGVDENGAQLLANQLRAKIERYNHMSLRVPLSASFGYAVKQEQATLMKDVLKEADNYMYREKLHHSHSARNAIILTVMKLLEERDFVTEEHAIRLQDMVFKLAEQLSLSERQITEMRLFAKFHDIGKIGIPDNILLKAGPLTAEEWTEMKRHCEIGYRIAQASPDLGPIADWILKHHEWWNGKGYPLGLIGGEIPLECRILAVADSYDAMTSDRPYRKAMSREAAIAELKRCSGTQFDPELVKIFIAAI